MNFLLNIYLNLKIKYRIFLLCFCYSLCIIFAVTAGRILHLAMAVLTTTIFVCLGIFFSSLLVWTLNFDLNRIISYLKEMTDGNLTQTFSTQRNNEISTICRSIDTLQATMRDIVSQLIHTSEQIVHASGDLYNDANQIARGTNEVELQTNIVFLASEQMTVTSSDIAQNCLSAAENSNHANSAALKGVDVVRKANHGMECIANLVKDTATTIEELGSSSEQISEIVGTIEDIADQTNLLALNAAIEAARAGDQGRGFAVVADEVRALAERTTKATREIGEMIKSIQIKTRSAVSAIEESVSEVVRGSEFSLQSGQALEQILAQINNVTMQINQIATAAEEQTATTAEISSNIHLVSTIVKQSALSASDTAAAAAQLSNEANRLQKLVGQFKLV